MSGVEIAEFLTARYAEQEAAIVRYRGGHPGEPCTNSISVDPNGEHYDEYDSCARHLAVAEATPYRDVEFGLADIAAKRLILVECVGYDGSEAVTDYLSVRVLYHLAAPFRHHPDFDPAWAVQ